MHAYLITGATPDEREEEIHKRLSAIGTSKFDTTYLTLEPEEEHIGIEAVRVFQKRLMFAPGHSAHTTGIVKQAQALTIEAQNALLKLLEEPPPHAVIFCETENPDFLLPTIMSRCQIIRLKTEARDESTLSDTLKTITRLLDASTGDKLALIDAVTKDRVSTKLWVSQAIAAGRNVILNDYKQNTVSQQTKKMITLIRLLTNCQRELEVNVNPRLVLDTVFLSLR